MGSHRKPTSSSSHRRVVKCKLCSEKTSEVLAMHNCAHKICALCARRYLEVKLAEVSILPVCPEPGCGARIRMKNCRKVLKPDLFKTLKGRLKESMIPVQDRIYCPYPKCSHLMSKEKIMEQSKEGEENGEKKGSDDSMYMRKCLKCGGKFCAECKVSWHNGMTCSDYKKLNPYSCTEDEELASLAKMNAWIQCPKCGHMVEHSEGCQSMTCSCGCMFCYKCGAEQGCRRRTCPHSDSDSYSYDSSCGCSSPEISSSSDMAAESDSFD